MRLLEADEERETRRVQRPKGNETIRRLMTGTHVSRLTTATAPKRRRKGAKLPSWSPSLSLSALQSSLLSDRDKVIKSRQHRSTRELVGGLGGGGRERPRFCGASKQSASSTRVVAAIAVVVAVIVNTFSVEGETRVRLRGCVKHPQIRI